MKFEIFLLSIMLVCVIVLINPPPEPTTYSLHVGNHGYESIRTVGTFSDRKDCVKVRDYYIKTNENMIDSYWCEGD